MRPHEINEFKRTAYQRYKYGNLLGLKASDEKSMQSLDVIYIKLNALFGQLKDLTFNPVNVITALEELRSEKGLTPFKNFTDEQVLEYLTSEEKNEYQKLKSISENKKVTTALKKANDFILYDWHNGNAYCFNKSTLKNIYELNIINSLSEKYVKDMVDYATLDTYIVKIKDDDFYNNKIRITFLDNYDDINAKLGSEKFVFLIQ